MADKTKSIKNASDQELAALLIRLRNENEVINQIMELKRKSSSPDPLRPYDYTPLPVSTEEPIESLYHNEAVEKTLAHFGVLGMKWGRRRGSDNSGGTKGKSANSIEKASRRKDVKNRRTMSDKDLLEKIGRLEKEKKLRELTEAEITPGKAATKEILKSAGSKVATTVVAGALLYGVQAALTKSFNPADMAKNMFFKK